MRTVEGPERPAAAGPAPASRKRAPTESRGRAFRTFSAGLILGVGLGAVGTVALIDRPDQQQTPEQAAPAEPAPTAPVPDGAISQLTWAPPTLDDPVVINVTASNHNLDLDPDQDYELRLPEEPLEAEGGVSVIGGHDVVLIGGEISVPAQSDTNPQSVRALFLKDQTGTVHVEGLLMSGDGLAEGINLDQREGAVVQLENIRVGTTLEGSYEGHHADLLQSWSGPAELRVDGLSGTTGYQGFFLLPRQFGDTKPDLFDLRRVDIVGAEGSAYLLWRDENDWPMVTQDVWVDPPGGRGEGLVLWPVGDTSSFEGVQTGRPPGGDFVPDGVAGVGYVSPGYSSEG